MGTTTTRITIERASGTTTRATYVRHLRTFTQDRPGAPNLDADLYRLDDGTEVICLDGGGARGTPEEWDAPIEHVLYADRCPAI